MEINFREVTLEDRKKVFEIIKDSQKRFCEYTFGNMYCWGAQYGMKMCITEDTLVIGSPEKARFNYPVGKNAKAVVNELKRTYENCTFSCLSEAEAKDFDATEMAGRFDYIYEREKLAELKGKKLAAKRNHINAFLADGEWHTEKITKDNVSLLYDFNKKWCKNYCDSQNASLKTEMCAVQKGLDNFEELGYCGLILYKNGEICAYSYGEPINSDTFCVHVEKADAEVRGAYQMINREFVRTFCEGYLYINREDDAGDEGLRRAKLSYYPTDLGRKFRI